MCHRAGKGSAWPATDLVLTTRTGRPIEPRNLVRSFRGICDGLLDERQGWPVATDDGYNRAAGDLQ
jgi:hypothetical protein